MLWTNALRPPTVCYAFTNRFEPMARPTSALITALRETAQRLHDGAPYAWSLMGQCNCGHLAQTLTQLSSKQIQQRALQRAGDWTTQAIDYCPSSGLPMEDIFATMLAAGLSQADVGHLEHLSDPAVLARIPAAQRPLQRNRREDAIRYLNAWADLLEEALLPSLPVPEVAPLVLTTA